MIVNRKNMKMIRRRKSKRNVKKAKNMKMIWRRKPKRNGNKSRIWR